MSLDGAGQGPQQHTDSTAGDTLGPGGTTGAPPPKHQYHPQEDKVVSAGRSLYGFTNRVAAHAGGGQAVIERGIDVASPLGWWWLFKHLGLSTKWAALAGITIGMAANYRGAGAFTVGQNPWHPSRSPLRSVVRFGGAALLFTVGTMKVSSSYGKFLN